ncbi:MAG TPA: YtxH domain-containing protein [Phnomibacter sp.]|nr:YtxH domain-containing protein [Phnomibacter sp.]
MTNTKKILLGTGAALAAGIVIGLLTAPQSGKESRKRLAKQAGKLREQIDGLRSKSSSGLKTILDNVS